MVGKIGVILAFIALVLVGCNNGADKPAIMLELDSPNTTISHLRSDIVGSRGTTIEDNIIVRGRVTSSDDEGNFYRSLFVEDDTGAVEVLVGFTPLAALYPEGLDVALHLKDCRADYWRGVLQVGVEALSSTVNSVDYIATREGVDKVISRGIDVTPLKPHVVDIKHLSRDMCGRLVTIRDVYATESTSIDTLAGETLDDALWLGSALFKDISGDSIAVVITSYANYANRPLPLSKVSITGILEWGSYASSSKECYHISMRYESDCEVY